MAYSIVLVQSLKDEFYHVVSCVLVSSSIAIEKNSLSSVAATATEQRLAARNEKNFMLIIMNYCNDPERSSCVLRKELVIEARVRRAENMLTLAFVHSFIAFQTSILSLQR